MLRGIRIVACVTSALVAACAFAQTYPVKPVKIIVSYTAGGGADLVARLVAQGLSDKFKQPFVVDNRPGASGMIGAEAVVRSAPDGYTLLLGGNPEIVINPGLFAKMPYDPIRDLRPIMRVAAPPNVIVASPSVAANTLNEVLKLAQLQPGRLACGLPGSGTAQHIALEVLKAYRNIDITGVQFKGAAPASAAVLGGHVQIAIVGAPPVMAHIRSGKLKALAVTQESRSTLLPDVPTIAEAVGGAVIDFTSWFGLFAPAGTPNDILVQIESYVSEVLARPEVAEKLAASGAEVVALPSAQFAALIRKETSNYAASIKRFNIRAE